VLTATLAVSLFLATATQQAMPQTSSEQDVVIVYPSAVPAPVPTQSQVPPRKRPKPKVTLTCFPAVSNARYDENGRLKSLVVCNVRVTDPDERFWCPGVAWSFADGFTPHSHEADCDPYDKTVAERGEPSYWSEGQEFPLPPGTYEIWAKLLKSGKVIGRESFVVRVN